MRFEVWKVVFLYQILLIVWWWNWSLNISCWSTQCLSPFLAIFIWELWSDQINASKFNLRSILKVGKNRERVRVSFPRPNYPSEEQLEVSEKRYKSFLFFSPANLQWKIKKTILLSMKSSCEVLKIWQLFFSSISSLSIVGRNVLIGNSLNRHSIFLKIDMDTQNCLPSILP